MMLLNFLLFLLSLGILIKSADFANSLASKIARLFHVSEFILSFFIVAVISTFPETAIAIVSAFDNIPSFGLATLIGSNVTDLTLVFGIVAMFSLKGIKVKSQILKNELLYIIILAFPVIFGFDGYLSRFEGILLIIGALVFFFTLSVESSLFRKKDLIENHRHLIKNLALLVITMGVLFISANFTVKFGVDFADDIGIPELIVGLILISVGTCLPELFFSIRAVMKNHDGLALGDILGTVIIDATIVIGIIALIKPFSFDPAIFRFTGIAMFLAGALALFFIKTGKTLSKKEGLFLLLFYIVFIIIEFIIN